LGSAYFLLVTSREEKSVRWLPVSFIFFLFLLLFVFFVFFLFFYHDKLVFLIIIPLLLLLPMRTIFGVGESLSLLPLLLHDILHIRLIELMDSSLKPALPIVLII
jgi:hypothetical protein